MKCLRQWWDGNGSSATPAAVHSFSIVSAISGVRCRVVGSPKGGGKAESTRIAVESSAPLFYHNVAPGLLLEARHFRVAKRVAVLEMFALPEKREFVEYAEKIPFPIVSFGLCFYLVPKLGISACIDIKDLFS